MKSTPKEHILSHDIPSVWPPGGVKINFIKEMFINARE